MINHHLPDPPRRVGTAHGGGQRPIGRHPAIRNLRNESSQFGNEIGNIFGLQHNYKSLSTRRNAVNNACFARTPSFDATIALIRISLVLISCTLIDASESAWNIR